MIIAISHLRKRTLAFFLHFAHQRESKINKSAWSSAMMRWMRRSLSSSWRNREICFKKSSDDFQLCPSSDRFPWKNESWILTHLWRVVVGNYSNFIILSFLSSLCVFLDDLEATREPIGERFLDSLQSAAPFWDIFIILTIICYTYIEYHHKIVIFIVRGGGIDGRREWEAKQNKKKVTLRVLEWLI